MSEQWHIPTRPLTPVDVVNRRAAATGSVRYAMLATNARYNGHAVSVSFKEHAVSGPVWNAEYWWAGRVVLGRGTFEPCLRAAAQEHARGDRGCSVSITLSAHPDAGDIAAHRALCASVGALPGPEPKAVLDGPMTAIYDAVSYEMGAHGSMFAGMISFALSFDGVAEEWPAMREWWLAQLPKKRGA